MKLFFRAAADEMQECSASIVLKYLQVNQTFKYRTNFEDWTIFRNIIKQLLQIWSFQQLD